MSECMIVKEQHGFSVYVSRFEAPWDNPGLACIDEESKLVFSHVMWEINTWPAVTWSDSLFFNHWRSVPDVTWRRMRRWCWSVREERQEGDVSVWCLYFRGVADPQGLHWSDPEPQEGRIDITSPQPAEPDAGWLPLLREPAPGLH
ncbi:uncharacterized protein LOC123511488 isoform X2 [Portunus trituberculatus]|uniref:uncharacterized protein LOC123511488 isoform X2 n=1 Tax=Portunus trituberculatus TaxID=210409 RepID=UPI001E1CCB07|nr:uncharacterized protein LOC123511488 isoform X2 [Portunus trituberculatus]